MIKRFYILLLAIVASVGMMNAKVTWNSCNMSNFSTDQPYTLEGVTLRANASFVQAYCDGNGDEIHFFSYETGGFTFSNTLGKNFTKIEMFLTSSDGWGNANLGSGWSFVNNVPVTWMGNASTVDLLKDAGDFVGASVKIVFYFEGDSEDPAPAKLSGAFTINADGDKIVFSRGNLQATTTDLGANWTWNFAPNQWSLIGDAVANNAINGNKKVSANGTVDLFGWSTAATYYGINESWKNDDYAGDFVDWGALMGTEWRTLSRAEFYYIVYSRAQAAYKRGQATVNGVPGYVLLPDAWTLPDGLSFTFNAGNYTTNQYDGAYWTAMENAGAVFLPAAGVREGTDIYQVNLYGWYWASTPNDEDGGKAYYLWFDKSSQGVTEYYRWKSKSVRLVTEAPLLPYEAAIKLINEIPNPVVLIAACKAKIDAARTAYDALSDGDKALVTNYSTLQQAEEAWQALIPDPVVLPTVKYAVCNVPDGWAVTANGDAVLPINGRYHIADGQTVVLTPPASTEVGSMTSAEEAGLLGAGTAEDPYLIYTVAHWNAVAAKVNDGTQAAPNCRQMANLDGVTTVMGNSESKPFKGIYDGNGFVFTNINLSITSGSNPLGLFGCVNDASAVVKNVVVAGGTVSSTSQNVGAIVGQLNGGTVQYCANYATVSSSYNGKVRMGGIVGWMRSAGGDNNRVNYCINYGNVSGVGYVGGITGSYGAGNVNYCQNHGSISSSGTDEATSGSAGGIIGWDAADDATKITYNHNGGNITLVKEHSYKPSRYIIANTNSNATSVNVIVPNSNSYLSSLTLTIGSTSYTGADLATHEPNAQALAINPEGITISGITYSYGVAAPVAPAPGTNPGTDPAKQSNKTWQFTMPSHNVGLTVIIYPTEVIELINELPNPVQESDLKLSVYQKVQDARAAYDALTAEQKALVEAATLKRLTDAEAAFAAIGGGGGAAAGALNGKFTINAKGDQIAFAKGNLQATTTDLGAHWTWGFAANQWNYLGIAVANSKIDGNGTVSENGTVDLFGWSTNATYYGINNSDKAVDYIGDFVDWGPNMGAGWRTLTKDEWAYLLQHSSNGKATVNDKNGYIFLPDNWSGPAFTPNPDNFTTNVYSGDDWTAMENAGAVFLPSGPARNRTYALIAMDARYSSSTSLNNDSSYVFTIYYNQSQSACTGTNRAYGCMVRLVSAGVNPLDQAQAVKDLIDAIPVSVTLDDACVNAIQAARDAYDALDNDAKAILDAADVKKLTDAEAALTALNKAEADKVVAKINNIPTPVELKLATRDSIESARAAYDALTAEQKALVPADVLKKLTDAEDALADLVPTPTPVPVTPTVWDMNELKVGDIIYEGDQLTIMSSPRYINDETIRDNKCPYTLMKSAGETSYVLKDKDGSYLFTDGSLAITPTSVGLLVTSVKSGDINVVVYSLANVLDSAQAVKDLIDAIPTPVEYPTSGQAIAAALVAYQQLSDAAKGALDAADKQKMTDAAAQYAALDAIAAIEAIPAEIVYDPAVKAAIESARDKFDALIDASKALVDAEVVAKLTNAEQAWADLVAKVEHNVSYIGKNGELKNEKVALLHIPDPAPDFNGHEFVRWDVKAGDFLEEGLRIKAVYTPIITTDPVAYDTLVYNGTAQELVAAGVAKEGHIEYRIGEGAWSADLPKADMAAAYVVDYKLVREGHEDYMAGSVTAVIAKAPVTYVAPQAYDTLAYNYNTQVLVTAGQTNDGTIEYSLDPNLLDSWSADLPQAMNAGTYAVYFRVQGDLNHFDSIVPAPVTVTIAKRDIEVTAPVAYDTLVYNALAQTLAAAGSVDFSTMEYTLTPDNGEGWSADMPQAVDAGTYAIYYRVQGDNNHNDYPAHSIAATIAQAPLTITAENKEVIYGDAAPEFTATYSGWMGQDDASVVSDLKISSDYAVGSSVGTYAIVPGEASALNYAMNYVNGTLTVNKAKVSVINAEAQKAKFADGHAVAVVLNQGTLDGVKLNDAVTHVTTAAFSSAEVAENLTITLFYELQGDEALLANYLLEPTSEIFSEEGVIIEPFLPDNEAKPEDEEAKIQEGIEVYAYGYCTGTGYSLNYHLNSGNPDQYKIEFEDSRFDDVAYEETKIAGSDGHIDIEIPDGLPTGDYKMSVTFRDSRFPWLESKAFDVTFHVNLPETYVKPLFNNTIILVDTCECMTDIQWYHRADATKTWQPVAGATGHYLHVDGQLTGEYFVAAKMNGVPTYTCGQEDMQTLYGADNNRQAKVRAYPNPVVNTTTVSIENSDSYEHNLRIVNLMGIEVMNTTFEGDDTVVNMDGYVTGNYTISVDGIAVKVLKQ